MAGAIAPDATEPNDSIGTAETFNLNEDADGDHAPELNDWTIHNATDVDFYKYTAAHTGNAILNLYFDKLFGDLDVRVKKGDGTVIATGQQGNLKDHLDFERIVFPVAQGESYFVEVFSAAGATGYYDLVIEKSVPELDLFVQAGIKTGSTLTGKLAFLQLDAKAIDTNFDGNNTDGPLHDGKDPTQIRADFTVDIFNKNNPGDERLSLFELGDLDAAIGVTADAEVNLDLTLGLNKDLLPDTISAALPTLKANFLLDWQVGGPISDFTLDGGLKLIEFRDIGVDLGLVPERHGRPGGGQDPGDHRAAPADHRHYHGPHPGPVRPGRADRHPGRHRGRVRRLRPGHDLRHRRHRQPGQLDRPERRVAVPQAGRLQDLPEGRPEHPGRRERQHPAGQRGQWPAAQPEPRLRRRQPGQPRHPRLQVQDGRPGPGPRRPDQGRGPSGFLDGHGGGGSSPTAASASSLFTGGFSSTPDNSGFDFPIFKDPSQFIGLLLGRDATLITYDLPPFLMNFKWEVSFPIYGPLWGVVSAGVGMKIDLAFGYDTAGVRSSPRAGSRTPST